METTLQQSLELQMLYSIMNKSSLLVTDLEF